MIPTPEIAADAGGFTINKHEFCCGDRPFRSFIYTFDPYEDHPYLEMVQKMYAQGVRIFSFILPLPAAWQPGGTYDFTLLDELHDAVLTKAPDALLLPRVFLTTPDWWDDTYPDELLKFSGAAPVIKKFDREDQKLWRYETKIFHGIKNASIASRIWQRDAGNALGAYVKHSTKKYPGHFLGFMAAYGTCGEWGVFGSYKHGRFGNADFSRPAVDAFREFLADKYGKKYETALPPAKTELLATQSGSLRSVEFCRHVLDYQECMAQIQAEVIDYFCGIIKANAAHSVITGSFGGAIVACGSSAYMAHTIRYKFIFDALMNTKNVDFFATPNGYLNRRDGVFSQGPVSTLSRKKHFIAECDVRSHLVMDAYSPVTEFDGINQFIFETGYNLCTGSGHLWWYDFGRGWYLPSKYMKLIGQFCRALPNIEAGEKSRHAEVAVVISPMSLALTEGISGYFRMFNQMLSRDLPACGAAFEVITEDEITQLKPYKLYIFRDLFYVNDKRRVELHNFFKTHHASCIWFYAAGCIGDSKVDAALSVKLTNIPVRMLPEIISSNSTTILNSSHFLCRGLDLPFAQNEVEKLETVWTPIIHATMESGEILGQIESVELPGMVYRQADTRFDFWAASPQLPVPLLRNLYEKAGVKLLVSSGAQFFGQHKLLVIRNRTAHPVSIKSDTPLQDILKRKRYYPVNGEITLPLKNNETIILKK